MTQKGRLIAITGGIGSGKSSVCGYLREKGYTVLDADEISRQLSSREDFLKKIASAFGDEFVVDGKLMRRELARFCFSDKERTQKLNSLFHGEIFGRVFALAEKAFLSGEKVCFVEVPLLFETGRQGDFDEVWIVTAPEDLRIERVKQRSGLTEEEVRLRMSAQYDYGKAQGVFIRNAGSKEELTAEIDELLGKLA